MDANHERKWCHNRQSEVALHDAFPESLDASLTRCPHYEIRLPRAPESRGHCRDWFWWGRAFRTTSLPTPALQYLFQPKWVHRSIGLDPCTILALGSLLAACDLSPANRLTVKPPVLPQLIHNFQCFKLVVQRRPSQSIPDWVFQNSCA